VTPDVATYLSNNPWATLTGGQRDDDHDGFGNMCDAKVTAAGSNVNSFDVAAFRAASNHARSGDDCGATGGRPVCANYDLDGVGANIGTGDFARLRALSALPAGGHLPFGSGRCPTCPLLCQAGTAGSCN
jgi:hypothetical protein